MCWNQQWHKRARAASVPQQAERAVSRATPRRILSKNPTEVLTHLTLKVFTAINLYLNTQKSVSPAHLGLGLSPDGSIPEYWDVFSGLAFSSKASTSPSDKW